MIRLFFSFYLILLAFVLAYQLFGVAARDELARELLFYDNTNDLVGELYLLDALHQTLTEVELKKIVAGYPTQSNIPLQLLEFDQLDIPQQHLEQLAQGEIYADDPIETILYSRLSNSDLVARLGPLGTYAPLASINNQFQQAIFVVLALSVFVWMLMLRRKLKRLEHSATRLGAGDFTARVSEVGIHRVGQLNHSFNLMAEQLERLISGHKSLTNAVAHELRTPVSRIRFQLDMLYEEEDDAQRNEYMFGMSDNINELTDLVDELLTYARFDREAPAIDMQPHSLHRSLLSIVEATELDSKAEVRYDDSWIQGNSQVQFLPFEPKHLERAIGNLLSNAQKYCASKVRISVCLIGNECSIIIDDDGPGIPEDNREGIFEPFKRLDNSRTRATGGYGLGLAIVKQIAEWHGGSIHIQNSPLGGARFVLAWPTDHT